MDFYYYYSGKRKEHSVTHISDIKYRFRTANMVMKLIYINIAVFLVLRIAGIVCYFSGVNIMSFLSVVELPSSFSMLASSPWTLLTYMFAHYDIFHILFNMLVLYWFGNIFLDFFTPKQFCGLYIIGGICGGLLYMTSYLLFPGLSGSSGWLIGASASIMAIVLATAVRAPHFSLNLLVIGPVALKWIAICYVIIDLLSIDGTNMGGHIAHLGGAAAGAAFALLIAKGTDISAPLNKFIDFISGIGKQGNPFKKSRNKGAANSSYQRQNKAPGTQASSISKEDEQTLDIILDKIKKSGYSSLTEEEKRRLFQVSSKKQ